MDKDKENVKDKDKAKEKDMDEIDFKFKKIFNMGKAIMLIKDCPGRIHHSFLNLIK